MLNLLNSRKKLVQEDINQIKSKRQSKNQLRTLFTNQDHLFFKKGSSNMQQVLAELELKTHRQGTSSLKESCYQQLKTKLLTKSKNLNRLELEKTLE